MVVANSFGTITPYGSDTHLIYGNSPNFFAEQVQNIGYRYNGGINFNGNISLSWKFYDPAGAGANAGGYRDMGYLNGFQTSYTPNKDYATGAPDPQGAFANGDEILGIGANTAAAGANSSVYQARLLYSSTANNGASYTGANGWFNTGVGRTIGWHTATITLGNPNGANTTVTESIDGNVVLSGIMSASSIDSVNSIILDSGWGTQVGAFDDFTLSSVPEPGTCALLGLGLAGLVAFRKRNKQ